MAAGLAAVAGAALGQSGLLGIACGFAGALAAGLLRRPGMAWLAALAVLAGWAAAARAPAPLPVDANGRLEATVRAVSDPAPLMRGEAFVGVIRDGPLAGARIAVSAAFLGPVQSGDTVDVAGRFAVRAGRLHRSAIAGWLSDATVRRVTSASGAMGSANALRSRVQARYDGGEADTALMRGFLIGDTAAMRPSDLDDMRRSGLLHFVAVSGGNVVIFLGAIWILIGLAPLDPRVRAAVGLSAIVIFVLVTRWEPSVVRAGLMVGFLLVGRIFGFPVDGWTSLGATGVVLALAAPEIVFDVGFQLSALATAGLLMGSQIWIERRPALLWRPLAATLAAQFAVTPLLLARFGSVPAFAPVANVLAGPLVTAATAIGWMAVLPGGRELAEVATLLAGVVLRISRWATALPQVGVAGLGASVAFVVALRRRPLPAVVALSMLVVALSAPPTPPNGPEVVFLDVGQGDAILLRGPSGVVIGVDTGPDPIAYAAALRRWGVGHLDLLVVTHSDGDHAGGLGAVLGRLPVHRVWVPAFESAATWPPLLGQLAPLRLAAAAGHRAQLGEFRLSVVGPGRRYESDNDGSLVLWVDAAGATLLLPGDIEKVAQRELAALRPDVLLVPHHGSKTTDLDWLTATVGAVAILSYGAGNPFGHPHREVVEALRAVGADAHHTAAGDVVVRLDRLAP